jgi:hypothetical protein
MSSRSIWLSVAAFAGLLSALAFQSLVLAPSPVGAADQTHKSEGPRYPVIVKAKPGFFAFGIPPLPSESVTVVSESSMVRMRIDGKLVGALRLGDDVPQIQTELASGVHRFVFTADIYAHDSVTYDGSCTGNLEVKDKPMTLRPWLDFSVEPRDPSKGHLSECQLIEW